MEINWAGRMAQVKQWQSARLMWAGAVLLVIVVVCVFFGFKTRFQHKQDMKDQQQTAMIASNSAVSSRSSANGPAVSGEVTPGSLATTPAAPAATTANGTKVPANPFANSAAPTAWAQASASTTPQSGTIPSTAQQVKNDLKPIINGPAEWTKPARYSAPANPMSSSLPGSSVEDFLRSEEQRTMKDRIAAREAPTGIRQQAQNTTVANPMAAQPAGDAVDQGQAELTRLSALVNAQGSGQSQQSGNGQAGESGGSAYTLGRPHSGGNTEQTGSYSSQNDQTEKRKFNEGNEGEGDDYLKTTRVPALSPWILQKDTEIPMAIQSRVNSDLPGDFQALVTADVLDSIDHRYVMIPYGSRAIFEYNSSVSYGQDRAQAVCTAIYFPDGSHIDLGKMAAHSADGTTGLKDRVDNHYKRLIGGIALTSVLAAGLQLSQNRSGNSSVLQYPSAGQVIAGSVGNAAAEAGSQLTTRNINIQPTVWIRPGFPFSVFVKKDILFPGPYESMKPVVR